MMEFIQKCDLFAIDVNLTYAGQKKFNTLLGGCLTITLVLAIMVSFPWLLYDKTTNPTYFNTQYTSQLADDSPTYQLNTT